MRKKYKPLLFLFAMVILATGITTQAVAQTGSITIQLEDGAKGTSKTNVSFICDKVADLVDGEYQLTEDVRESRVNLNKIEYANDAEIAAKRLYAYTSKKGMRITTDKSGKATLNNLDSGMYLIYTDEKNNYELISPTLVSVPTWNEQQKEMDYEVVVIPKHSPNPYTPKTGDNSPLFLYFGVAFATGIFCVSIIFKRKDKKGK